MDLRITCLIVLSIPVLQLVLLLKMMPMSYVLVSNDYIYTYVHLVVVHGSTYANCTDGQVRLFGGSTNYEGTVEICINHAWGTIHDEWIHHKDRWRYQEAQTVCNALGYTAPGMKAGLY